jgi:hypothetical protein
MSNNSDDKQTPPDPAPDEDKQSGKKKNRRRGKKKDTGSGGSSTPGGGGEPQPSKAQQPSGFGDGNKVLEGGGLSISGRFEELYSAPNTEGYFQFVEAAYDRLLSVKPDIGWVMTRSEWIHIHALLIYARTSEVYFQVTGKKQAPPVRIPLPYDVRVFQPIWAILSDIGLVEDHDLKVRYIPLPKLPETEDLTDPDDAIAVFDCTMYDWPSSWEQVEADRIILDNAREEQNFSHLTGRTEQQKKPSRAETYEFSLILKELKRMERVGSSDYDDLVDDRPDDCVIGEKDDSAKHVTFRFDIGGVSTDTNIRTSAEAANLFQTLITDIKAAKSQRIRRTHPTPDD